MLTQPGVYCLRSNQTDWDEATLWRAYITLTDIQAVFRSLKSELGLRPIYHHEPVRAEGHLFITVIAYQPVRACLGVPPRRPRRRATARIATQPPAAIHTPNRRAVCGGGERPGFT